MVLSKGKQVVWEVVFVFTEFIIEWKRQRVNKQVITNAIVVTNRKGKGAPWNFTGDLTWFISEKKRLKLNW